MKKIALLVAVLALIGFSAPSYARIDDGSSVRCCGPSPEGGGYIGQGAPGPSLSDDTACREAYGEAARACTIQSPRIPDFIIGIFGVVGPGLF